MPKCFVVPDHCLCFALSGSRSAPVCGANGPSRGKHVAAGFQPAFSHQNNFLFEFERGLEARGYVLDSARRAPAVALGWPIGRVILAHAMKLSSVVLVI